MSEQSQCEQLREQRRSAMERQTRVIHAMSKLIAVDLSDWLLKAAREAYIISELSPHAEAQVDVVALKRAVRLLTEEARTSLRGELQKQEVWAVTGDVTMPPFEALPVLQSVLGRWEQRLATILEGHGVVEPRVHYAVPRYFVNGQHLPAMLDEFWRIHAQLEDLDGALSHAESEARRGQIAARWDEAP